MSTSERLYTHTLWMESLYEAYPNGFTLWLWKRAYRKLRRAYDEGVKATTIKSRVEPSFFMAAILGLSCSVKAPKAAAMAAQRTNEDYLRCYLNATSGTLTP